MPVTIEISADWVSMGNVLAVRWGIVPLPFPKRQIFGNCIQDREGTHPKMAALGNCMESLDFWDVNGVGCK